MIWQRTLRREVAQFQAPIWRKSVSQLTTSFGCFFATCAAMYAVIDVSTWMALALAPLGAVSLVRIFIIQHDCGHLAFFRSRRANDILGFACSLLTLTTYASWRRQHAGHHGVWNDLDRRQSGADIYSSCLTVAEYRALSPWRRRWYRTTRHSLIANVRLPPLIFILLYRLPFDMPKSWRQERRAVHLTTLALVVGPGRPRPGAWLRARGRRSAAGSGPRRDHRRLAVLGAASGRKTRWSRHDAWDPTSAALQSSTYLRLPAGLQWFTGNIGFHHVHHLNPRVPNYRLQECHEPIATRCDVLILSFREGLRALRFVLWDEGPRQDGDGSRGGTGGHAMKLFECQHCGQLLYFENTRCERCEHVLGNLPDRTTLSALTVEGGDRWRPLATPDEPFRFCANAL